MVEVEVGGWAAAVGAALAASGAAELPKPDGKTVAAAATEAGRWRTAEAEVAGWAVDRVAVVGAVSAAG